MKEMIEKEMIEISPDEAWKLPASDYFKQRVQALLEGEQGSARALRADAHTGKAVDIASLNRADEHIFRLIDSKEIDGEDLQKYQPHASSLKFYTFVVNRAMAIIEGRWIGEHENKQ